MSSRRVLTFILYSLLYWIIIHMITSTVLTTIFLLSNWKAAWSPLKINEVRKWTLILVIKILFFSYKLLKLFNYEIVYKGERPSTPTSALPHWHAAPPPHGHHPYNAAHQRNRDHTIRSIADHPRPNPSAINISGQLANPIPGSGSQSSIDAWLERIDAIAPVTVPTISEPDPDEEYQASNTTTSPKIDLNNWRVDFLGEILKWTEKPGCPNKKAILTTILFLPCERIAKKSLEADRRRYERRCFSQRESVSESFPIYGRPETEQFDRLKCWVHFNLHLMHGHIWPDGYKPIGSPAELKQLEDDDDLSTVFELESVADSEAPSCIG